MTSSSFSTRAVAADDWPRLAADFADLGFEQTRTYAEAAAQRIGGVVRFLAVEDGGRPVAAAAVRVRTVPLLGRGVAWCPSGPLLRPGGRLTDPVPALEALRADLAVGQGHVLRLRPSGTAFADPADWADAARAAGFAPAPGQRPYHSICIDLAESEEALMRRLNGKWRTDLRFAMKSGLEVDAGAGPAHQARFLALLAEVQDAKGFRIDITPEFHFALSGPDYRCEVLIATHEGQDLAGIVVGHAGPCSTYLFGATGAAGRPLRAGYFLTWDALRRARAAGARWYDLGGVDAVENPDVARFKERMNGVAVAADAWETAGPGPAPRLIRGLERLHARMKGR